MIHFKGLLINSDGEKSQMKYTLEYSNELLCFNLSKGVWENDLKIENKTFGRHFHSSVEYKGKMYIFGGKSGSFFNEILCFDLEIFKFETISVKSDEKPTKRHSQSCVVFKDSMYIFGGYDENAFSCNDLWEFSFNELKWKEIKVEKKPPSRYHHRSVLIDEKMYIFGGLSDNLKVFNDLWVYDFLTKNWNQVKTSGQQPISKYGFQMLTYQKNIFIYGGRNHEIGFEDVDFLDLKTLKWNTLSKDDFPHDKSPGSVFTSHVLDNDTFYLFGGIFVGKTKDILEPKKLILPKNHSKLPDDTIKFILSYLDIHTLCTISCVSKTWSFSILSNDDIFWKSQFEHFLEKYQFLERSQYKGIQYKKSIIQIRYDFVKYINNKYKYTPFKEKHDYIGSDFFLAVLNLKSSVYKLDRHPDDYNNGHLEYIKCVFVGQSGNGKTSLIMKNSHIDLDLNNPDRYIPSIFDVTDWEIPMKDQNFKLQIWDTCGEFYEFDRLRPLYYPCSRCIVLTFSVVSLTSYENIKSEWINEVKKYNLLVPIILCGTKIDLRNNQKTLKNYHKSPITYEEGVNLAKELGCVAYIETSSVTSYGLETLKKLIFSVSTYHGDLTKKLNKEKEKCLIQ